MPNSFDHERRESDRRLAALEFQVGRLVSDAESEKDTRRRVSQEWVERFNALDNRIRVLERNMYIAIGAIAVLQLVLRMT